MKKYYDDPKDNAAFDRCIDVMTRLILKYGKQVLESQESDKNNKIIELDAREEKNNGIKEKRRVAFLREMCYI